MLLTYEVFYILALMVKQLLLVFIGGGVGSIIRFLLGKLLNSSTTTLPYGTLVANVIGALIIGLVLGWSVKQQWMTTNHTLLLATGFCGGLTTFSTFAYENHNFIKAEDYVQLGVYLLLSLILGIAAVFLGMYLSR